MENDPIKPRASDEHINDLYWNSSRTIDDILGELRIGRETLYDTLQGMPAGVICLTCTTEAVFANRTDRASGTAVCLTCGVERMISDRESASAPSNQRHDADDRGHRGASWSRWREELAGVVPERAALIGGAAALGVMMGAAAARAYKELEL